MNDRVISEWTSADVNSTSCGAAAVGRAAMHHYECVAEFSEDITKSSAIAEGPRDASCQLKSCQLPRNSAETTYTTSPDQIDGMKLEV